MFTKIKLSTNTTGQGANVEGNDNYIVEDAETDTIQTQEGLSWCLSISRFRKYFRTKSDQVIGDDNELEQYIYGEAAQDQLG